LMASLTLIGMLFLLPSGTPGKIELPIIELPGDHTLMPPPIFEVPRPQTRPVEPQVRVENETLPPRVVTTPVETPITNEPVLPAVSGTGDEGAVVTGAATGVSTGTVDIVTPTPSNAPVFNPEVAPAYENGYAGMMKYFQKNLKYPPAARRLGIEGSVYVSFIVNADGSVSDVTVIRGFHPDCDKEAARVVSKMPGWSGGKHGGFSVRVKMVLPIKFKLDS
jgi:periplasmic protein TonB